jgi:hypothetical protein
MPVSQTTNGKAFEWATADQLSKLVSTNIKKSEASEFARSCFESLSPKTQSEMCKAADLAVSHIYQLESLESVEIAGEIEIAKDSKGQTGDVRDIVLATVKGEIGISCKNNHDAFKHSRLSRKIDFVNKWELSKSGCTDIYWNDIQQVFIELDGIQTKSAGSATWKSLPNVHTNIYKPLMQAFSPDSRRAITLGTVTIGSYCKEHTVR